MMKSTLIKDLYGEIERLKSGESFHSLCKVKPFPYNMWWLTAFVCYEFVQRFMLHVRKMVSISQRKDTIRRRVKGRYSPFFLLMP